MTNPLSKQIRIDTVFADGYLRTGVAEHRWSIEDPLTVEVRFTVLINSVPIVKDEFPVNRPACDSCNHRMRYGTYGVVAPDGSGLFCVNCATRDQVLRKQEETWTVGLQLYIDALLDQADRQVESVADIVITRPSKNYLLMTIRDDAGWMKVSVPITPLKEFLSQVNVARKALGPVLDQKYTENGIAALEKLANRVE